MSQTALPLSAALDDKRQNADESFTARATRAQRVADRKAIQQSLASRIEVAEVATRLPLDDVPLHDQAGERCLF